MEILSFACCHSRGGEILSREMRAILRLPFVRRATVYIDDDASAKAPGWVVLATATSTLMVTVCNLLRLEMNT